MLLPATTLCCMTLTARDVNREGAVPVSPRQLSSDSERQKPEKNTNQNRVDSENDLFFHFSNTIDEHGFRQGKEQQKLTVKFYDYITISSECIKEPQSHLEAPCCAHVKPTKDARLDHHAVVK